MAASSGSNSWQKASRASWSNSGCCLRYFTGEYSSSALYIGKASFKYADKILSDWQSQGIRHLEDVSSLDKQKASQKAIRPNSGTAKPNNRFHNFEQRQYDDDFYDTLEQQLLRK